MHKPTYSQIIVKKLRRTILRSPLQFLTMILIIMLGTTLLSGFYASHLCFKDQIERTYAKSNAADIYTTLIYDPNSETLEQDIENDFNLIKNVIGDSGTIETQHIASAQINALNNYVFLTDDFPTINAPYEFFHDEQHERKNFFIFSQNFAENTLYGERSSWFNEDGSFKEIPIQLSISQLRGDIDEELLPVLENYKISRNILDSDYLTINALPTATMHHPENILGNAIYPSLFLLSRSYLKTLLDNTLTNNYNLQKLEEDIIKAPDPEKEKLIKCQDLLIHSEEKIMKPYWHNNRILIRLNNPNDTDKYVSLISNAFAKKTDSNLLSNVSLANTTTYQQLITEMSQTLNLCYVFPPIFFLVAILITLTTLSQIILKERGEIGTLKALGVFNRTILIYYLMFGGIISLIGAILGIIIGPFTIPFVLGIKQRMIYTVLPLHFVYPVLVSIILVLAVITITMFVTYLIARKEIKALPAVSMRPKISGVRKKSKIDTTKQKNTHKICFNIAKRNIFCSIQRSMMVVIGILGCSALLCCGFSINDSIDAGVNHDVNTYFQTDSIVYLSGQDETTFDGFKKLMTGYEEEGVYHEPVISVCEPYGYLPTVCNKSGVNDKTFSTMIYSIIPSSPYDFFNFPIKPSGDRIVVTNKIAKNLNLHEGEEMSFKFLGVTYTGKIKCVMDSFFIHGIFIDGYNSQFPLVTDYPTNVYVRYNNNVPESEVIKQIQSIHGVATVLSRSQLTKTVDELSSSISYITITIVIFAVLLAIIALYNLALLNFNENIRNIATMKVLGFNRIEIAESLFFEIMILTLVGTVVGLSIGFPLAVLTLKINYVPSCEFFYYLSAGGVFASFFISVGVAIIVNAYLSLKNKKVKMVESLKSVE